MVDSIQKESYSNIQPIIVPEKKNSDSVLLDINTIGELSDAEIKFLSVCREKAASSMIINNILKNKLTLNNYEEMFCLKEFQAIGGTINPEQAVRNIRYRDKNDVVVATVQIDTVNKKIRMQNLGDILPKQECFTPSQVGAKLKKMFEHKNWTTEDGGVNQFNGNVEIRYKDENGYVMAAIITKENGIYDTIAEYEYKNGYRSQMLLTNHFGQSKVIYDGTASVNQLVRIDIDTDGVIIELTKVYSQE